MPKIVDHDQKRIELLVPCLELFASRGFHALSVREIARTLDVTTGTLYHYFKNKTELFEKMLEHVIQLDVADALREVPAEQPWSTKLVQLAHYLSARERRFTQVVHVVLDFKRYEEGDTTPITRRVISAYRDTIQTQLNLQESAQIDVVFSLLMGIMLYRDLDADAKSVSEQMIALIQFGELLRGQITES